MADDPCPCGGAEPFERCCGRFLGGEAIPETAEALMRSRYTAYVRQDIGYLKRTLWPKYQDGFDELETARWAAESHWTGLKILKTEQGGKGDRDGTVLFEAGYLSGGTLRAHRELSRFRKKAGRWYYVEAVPE